MGGLSKELHDLLHEKQYAKEAILGLIETPDKNFSLGQYQKKHFDGMTISGNQYELFAYGVPKYSTLPVNRVK
jgi:hypothetical protein